MRPNNQISDVKDFIYLAALPKSASSLVWLILSSIQESSNRPDQSKLENAIEYILMPMSLEHLESFPRGGVYKNHAPMDYHNDRFLKLTGCKYVVLVRHPADHLAAVFCHGRFRKGLVELPAERITPWQFSVGQISLETFDTEPEIVIEQLIRCGYLFKSLIWMTDWIAFRNQGQSRLLRYEDILNNFETIVTELCWFIRGAGPDEDLLRYLTHVRTQETSAGDKKSAQVRYPRGWTGHIGTWNDYFSNENIEAYNQVINDFMMVYPQAKVLASSYPDLRISRS